MGVRFRGFGLKALKLLGLSGLGLGVSKLRTKGLGKGLRGFGLSLGLGIRGFGPFVSRLRDLGPWASGFGASD